MGLGNEVHLLSRRARGSGTLAVIPPVRKGWQIYCWDVPHAGKGPVTLLINWSRERDYDVYGRCSEPRFKRTRLQVRTHRYVLPLGQAFWPRPLAAWVVQKVD